MISVICIYNNKDILQNCLVASLAIQKDAEYECVFIDSVKEGFKSASKALNYGGDKAHGDFLLFAHQDIVFENEYTLKKIQEYCRKYTFGIAGVAGETSDHRKGIVSKIVHGENKAEAGEDIFDGDIPLEAITLDECLFVIPASFFHKVKFRYIGDTWHLYATDYVLQVEDNNAKALLLPIKLWHTSAGNSFSTEYFKAIKSLARLLPPRRQFQTVFGSWPTNRILLNLKCCYREIRYKIKGC